jgi:hypothetical protein
MLHPPPTNCTIFSAHNDTIYTLKYIKYYIKILDNSTILMAHVSLPTKTCLFPSTYTLVGHEISNLWLHELQLPK